MQEVVARTAFAPRRFLLCLAAAAPLAVAAGTAQAQDLFGFLRLFSGPAVRVPVNPSYDFRPLPDFGAPVRRFRPRVVRAEQPKVPLKPKPMGQVDNPVPALLADSTLRRGDIVMFPDGPRVFKGEHGARHALADFEPLVPAQGSPPSGRKLAATLRPGLNAAWSVDTLGAGGKLAHAAKDVETTGSVKRTRP